VSIVDYFLLMPADLFEGPPSVWLQHARTGGEAIQTQPLVSTTSECFTR
jgi:hypothetical protein